MASIWQTPLMKRSGTTIRDRIQDLRTDVEDIKRSISIITRDEDGDSSYFMQSQVAQKSVKILRESLEKLEKELREAEQTQYINVEDLQAYLNKFRLVPRDNPIGEAIDDKTELEWVSQTK